MKLFKTKLDDLNKYQLKVYRDKACAFILGKKNFYADHTVEISLRTDRTTYDKDFPSVSEISYEVVAKKGCDIFTICEVLQEACVRKRDKILDSSVTFKKYLKLAKRIKKLEAKICG